MLNRWWIILGAVCVTAAGLALVAALLLGRRDLRAEATAGPAWKRRFLRAGLALLPALSILSDTSCITPTCYEVALPGRVSQPSDRLARLDQRIQQLDQQQQSKHLSPETIEAAIASAQQELDAAKLAADPDDTPSHTRAQQIQAAIASLQAAHTTRSTLPPGVNPELVWRPLVETWDLGTIHATAVYLPHASPPDLRDRLLAARYAAWALKRSGWLSAAEATAVIHELNLLADASRPPAATGGAEESPATPTLPHQRAPERLRSRLPHFRTLATQLELSPVVFGQLLRSITPDMAILRATLAENTPGQDASEVNRLLDASEIAVYGAMRKAAVGAGDLGNELDWKKIHFAWQLGERQASGTQIAAQRDAALHELHCATAAAAALAKTGRLSLAEATFLGDAVEQLRDRISRPAVDDRMTCYYPALVIRAKVSLERLAQRLPLLKSMVESNRVHAPVLAKILPAIRGDLATLADRKEKANLSPAQQAQAAQVYADVQKQLDQIERLQSAGPTTGRQ